MLFDATPPFIAGQLALDFLNTRFGVGEQQRECLEDDADVIAWLLDADALDEPVNTPPTGIAEQARNLREHMRSVLAAAREGKSADITMINLVLQRGQPLPILTWSSELPGFQERTMRRDQTSESFLYPIAQALVELVTEQNLRLVKQCEGSDCILLFYDQTKSRRRRWCSMATCGNRMKAAAHRARKTHK